MPIGLVMYVCILYIGLYFSDTGLVVIYNFLIKLHCIFQLFQDKMIFMYAAILLIVVEIIAENNVTITPAFNVENVSFSKVLSRRKRFLIFPDGSSVQLGL